MSLFSSDLAAERRTCRAHTALGRFFGPCIPLAVSLALALGLPSQAGAVDLQAVDRCHQALLRGLAAVSRGRISLVGRCLKEDNWDACPETDLHAIAHENELRNMVAGPSSWCRAAIDSGASLADFGPDACASDWADCDAEIPSIASLEDLAECLVCQQRGFDFRLRGEFGLPRAEPSDPDERRCTRSVARLVSKTARVAIFDTASCASGGIKPFACAVDAGNASRFGAALARYTKTIARCGIDEGRAPGALANFCGGSAADAAGLAACFADVTKCVACRTANTALGQSDDCVAFSGVTDCDGNF